MDITVSDQAEQLFSMSGYLFFQKTGLTLAT